MNSPHEQEDEQRQDDDFQQLPDTGAVPDFRAGLRLGLNHSRLPQYRYAGALLPALGALVPCATAA
jgi:hypothetical protein